jgi:hypothetical protein
MIDIARRSMSTTRLSVAFDAFLPMARYGPLFQILRLELPDLRLEWQTNSSVVDVVHEPFLDAQGADPEWRAFWTLDKQRGGPPSSARIVSMTPNMYCTPSPPVAPSPPSLRGQQTAYRIQVAALRLSDGPWVATRLLWRSEHHNPIVSMLTGLADDPTANHPENGARSLERDVVKRPFRIAGSVGCATDEFRRAPRS